MTQEHMKAAADGVAKLLQETQGRTMSAEAEAALAGKGDVAAPIRLVPVDHDPFADEVQNR
jgi:hypothetical protein